MEFEQDEPPYFPGEEGNDPFERSKFALAHIWHEVSARICAKLCSLKDRKRRLTDPVSQTWLSTSLCVCL